MSVAPQMSVVVNPETMDVIHDIPAIRSPLEFIDHQKMHFMNVNEDFVSEILEIMREIHAGRSCEGNFYLSYRYLGTKHKGIAALAKKYDTGLQAIEFQIAFLKLIDEIGATRTIILDYQFVIDNQDLLIKFTDCDLTAIVAQFSCSSLWPWERELADKVAFFFVSGDDEMLFRMMVGS